MSGHVDAAAAWIYRGVWATIVSWFRVPADPPTLPATGEPVRSIRPADGYLRYLKFLFWVALIPGDVLPVARLDRRLDRGAGARPRAGGAGPRADRACPTSSPTSASTCATTRPGTC